MAIAVSEGSYSKSVEHNEREPVLADDLGNHTQSGDARNLAKIVSTKLLILPKIACRQNK